MIQQRIEGVTMAGFAAGYTHAKKSEVLVLFDSTPGEDAEIKTKSGIILLGREAMPNYEKKPTSNSQKTIYGRIVANPWYEWDGEEDSKGKPVKFRFDTQEGDIAELYGPAFADLKFGNKVWQVDDGVVAVVPCSRIACLHRNGVSVPFGPHVLMTPIPVESNGGLYTTLDKYQKGRARLHSVGCDTDGALDGVNPGAMLLFDHAKAVPYTITLDDESILWQVKINQIYGVEQ